VTIEPYRVVVVVDRNFGERLATLSPGVAVWIVDTPANTPAARRLWKERPESSHLTGITTYNGQKKGGIDASPEENVLNQLSSIDLHHGPYSTKRPYVQLEVIGTPLSDKLKIALAEYGFREFSTTSEGFLTTREDPGRPQI
jgi:hypothetical protein